MDLYKLLNGERVKLTSREKTRRLADEAKATAPPTQAEIDKELDQLSREIDTGATVVRALGVEVFLMLKAADPTLTPSQFRKRIRDRIAGFK